MSLPTDTPLFSPYWYKLGILAPRLRPGVHVTRRVEQGEVWHILSAPESNRHFRLDEASWAIIGALDGRQKLDTIWKSVLDRFGDAAPGQDETIRLLGQLHQADALNSGTKPTLAEYERRARRQARQKALQQFKNPLFVRISLFDPKRLVDATFPFVAPFFTPIGFLVWLAALIWLGTEVARNWEALSATVVDRALAVDNLIITLGVFPFAKFIHEMAHGWAVKRWGGEVREVGIMFLVFLPAPFVDASAAGAFKRKIPRIMTSAAGMMAEVFLAALAMFVWTRAETGFATALAFNVMLIAGVSTVLFNGNPLLRFDAYFMLCDAIGVQNLGTRSQKWWAALLHRKFFGLDGNDSPARTRTEAAWFIFYHPASYAYRIFLTLTIALFVASEYPLIGITLAAWAIITTFILPLLKSVWHVMSAPRVAPKRRRALVITGLLIGLPVAALFTVPVPHGTVAAGVVVEEEDLRISAPTEAIMAQLPVRPGDRVTRDMLIADLAAPLLDSEQNVMRARVAGAMARVAALEAQREGAGEAAATRAELGYLREEEARLTQDGQTLALRAPGSGILLAREETFLPGRRFAEGTQIGSILPEGTLAVLRVAVPADRIEEVRAAPHAVAVQHPGRPFAPVNGIVQRIAPEATRILTHPALSSAAGGPLTIDPTGGEGQRTAQPFHLTEIASDLLLSDTAVGALIWVRFDHGPSPLAPRIWRSLRQTFLTDLNL